MAVVVVRYSERPELCDRVSDLSSQIWPEYNLHGDVTNPNWDRLYVELPEHQFVLYDEEADDVLAEGNTIPCRWDGTPAGLGPGIDDIILGGRPRPASDTLSRRCGPAGRSATRSPRSTAMRGGPTARAVRSTPWIRTHLRLGGEIAAAAPKSLRITGSVAEWESWTEMEYPETGDYVFPHGLAPLHVDREADVGSYWEPNVWIVHRAG